MALIITDEMWREVLSAPDPQYYTGTAAAAFARLTDHAGEAGFTGDEMRQLAEVMAPVSADPEMLRIWYRIVQTLSVRNERADQLAARMSGIAGIMDPYGFNLLVVLGLVPFMEQLYREMGWYDELWTEALLDIRIWMDFCRENNDAFGISFAFPWIRHQSVGAVLRLGRLQCNDGGGFYHEYRVYRRKNDTALCVLMDCTMNFRKDGFCAFADEETAFTTAPVVEDENGWTGWMSTENGIVLPDKITLAKSEWEEFLKPDDPVIHLHIPADGPLLPEMVVESCRKMVKFHREKLNRKPKAFVCESWLLDPMFDNLLPEKSNILKFKRMGYCMPGAAGESELIRRVFGSKAIRNGVNTVPHKTSMQKIFAAYLNGGGHARNGAFVIPFDTICS